MMKRAMEHPKNTDRWPDDFENGYRNVPAEDLLEPLGVEQARELLVHWFESKGHHARLYSYVRAGVIKFMGQFALNCARLNPDGFNALVDHVVKELYVKIYNGDRKLKLTDRKGRRFKLSTCVSRLGRALTDKVPNSVFEAYCPNYLTEWNIWRHKHAKWRDIFRELVSEMSDNRKAMLAAIAEKMDPVYGGATTNPRRRAEPIVYACMDIVRFILNEGDRPQLIEIAEQFSITSDDAEQLWMVVEDFSDRIRPEQGGGKS